QAGGERGDEGGGGGWGGSRHEERGGGLPDVPAAERGERAGPALVAGAAGGVPAGALPAARGAPHGTGGVRGAEHFPGGGGEAGAGVGGGDEALPLNEGGQAGVARPPI